MDWKPCRPRLAGGWAGFLALCRWLHCDIPV